ncbi:MAG: CotH kinase family protein [Verrucomicrobiota bacterium]
MRALPPVRAGQAWLRHGRARLCGLAALVLAGAAPAGASLADYDTVISREAAGGLIPAATLTDAITFPGNQNAAFNFGPVTGDGTFECIVEPSGLAASAYLAVGSNTQSNLRLQQYNNTGELGMTLLGVADYRFSPAVPAPAETAHLVWLWDGAGTMQMFVNGTPAGSRSGVASPFALPTGQGWLGANPSSGEGMSGTVFRVTTYDSRLSVEAIRRHAEAFLGILSPPVISSFSADPPAAASGATVTLSWTVSGADTLTLDGTAVTGLSGKVITLTANGSHTLAAANAHGTTTRTLLIPMVQAASHVVINEFMASNQSGLTDETGAFPDWLELYNPTSSAVNLAGYYLTDNPANPQQWALPAVSLPAGGYLVIFLSGRDTPPLAAPWHANFRLNKDGEYLALTTASGVVHEFSPAFPPQEDDLPWALTGGDPGLAGYAERPTPGTANDPALPRPARVQFSQPGGLLRGPVSLTLSSGSPGAQIFYQINQAPASAYTSPIEITATAQVRAWAEQAGQRSAETTTAWVKLAPDLATYQSPLPVLMIDNFASGAVPQKGWSGNGSGVQQVPRQAAAWLAWERSGATSTTASEPAFSSRIGLRGRGAFSSSWRQKPYSVEAMDASGSELDVSVLGMPAHSNWVLYFPDPGADKDPTLLFNTFVYDLARRLGHPSQRFRWVELFVNEDGGDLSLNDRRGVYAVLEKVSRGAERLDFSRLSADGQQGGWLLSLNRMDAIPETGWPALNGTTTPSFFRTAGANRLQETQPDNPATGGDDEPKQSNGFLNFDNPGGYTILPAQRAAVQNWFRQFEDVLYGSTWRDPATGYRQWLDADDFAGYFVFNELTKNGDGMLISMFPWKGDDGKLRMGPVWDYNYASYYAGGGATGSLRWRGDRIWYARLFADPDFLQLYTDRWFAWRQGAMSNAGITDVIDDQAAEITAAKAVAQGISSAAAWNSSLTQMKSWLTQRATWVDGQYAARPVLSPAGGIVSSGQEIALTAVGGVPWHTTDRSDPRLAGGTVSPAASSTGLHTIAADTRITARNRVSATRWSAPASAIYVTGAIPATALNLTFSEIHYHPAPPDAAEFAAGFTDPGDFEFVELLNAGADKISLAGLRLVKTGPVQGIDYRFDEGTQWSLAPGARLLLVRNIPAFTLRYGPGLPVAGEFAGQLGNGGDTLTLLDAASAPLLNLTWTDITPWPSAPDGAGYSLTLLSGTTPLSAPNSVSWRASTARGGSPGTSDSLPLTDGGLASYAFGTAPSTVTFSNGTLFVTQPRRPGSDLVSVALEHSLDLTTWVQTGPEEFATEPDADGITRIRRQLPAGAKGFFRWHLRSR